MLPKLEHAFSELAEKHVKGEITGGRVEEKEDRITGERLEEEAEVALEVNGEVGQARQGAAGRNHCSKEKGQADKG